MTNRGSYTVIISFARQGRTVCRLAGPDGGLSPGIYLHNNRGVWLITEVDYPGPPSPPGEVFASLKGPPGPMEGEELIFIVRCESEM